MPRYRANNNFGIVSSIGAQAVGEPGRRTFRLVIEAGRASAHLWLEKEQLQQLAVYIDEIGEDLPGEGDRGRRPEPEPTWTGGNLYLEFKLGSLSLVPDAASKSFLFLAFDRESPGDDTPDLSFWVPLDEAQGLSKEALEVCAAGRPRCLLCGLPINADGHMCVRANGHQPIEP